jgi:hypothetical protein
MRSGDTWRASRNTEGRAFVTISPRLPSKQNSESHGAKGTTFYQILIQPVLLEKPFREDING